ncbi:MAG: YhgE/Pip family protein [Agrococcus casei]|uniref:YhgE/Pip family protein n=1 Tax=Agrococcus casei TaxID=343512 RepID=UPI003F998484
MKLPQLALAELRRLTATPMSRLALLALAIVPLLYGGIYLWANQDPYSNLDQVPAALVVEDTGHGSGDDRQNVGQDVAENVIEDGSFDWHLVNAEEAAAGVDNGDYDFSLTLPKTFTEDLLSASGDNPRAATIVLTTNDANSYLASTIGGQAVNRIQAQVREQVGEEAAVRMLTSIQQIREGMVEAADGAQQLTDGLSTAESGAADLADGTAQLADGAAELRDGAATLTDGAQQVADGNARIAAAGTEVASVTGDLANSVDGTRADIVQRLEASGLTDAQIAEVMQPLDALGQDIRDGNGRVQEVNGQLQQLAGGAQQVADGAAQLRDGAGQLTTGAEEATDGADTLHSGIADLHTGAAQLQNGLDDGVARIPSATDEQIRDQAATMSAPVETNAESVTSAGTYGAGLAPFFVALAAWIGIYALMLIIKPFSKRAITALRSPLRVGAAAWLTPAFFGVLQMIALFGVIAVWLGFNIELPLPTLGLMVLSSMTFAAIIVALNVWLGSVGQFLGLVMMVVQLVVAGGTFPWQTLPAPLAALHHVMPMSYTVDGLRQVMYGGSMEAAQTDALVLLAFLAAAFALIVTGTARMMHHRTMRDLQPSLIG